MSELPLEMWGEVAGRIATAVDCINLGMVNREMSNVTEEHRQERECDASPATGTHRFKLPHESKTQSLERRIKAKDEYNEMTRRLDSELKISKVNRAPFSYEIDNCFRVYKKWKEWSALHSDVCTDSLIQQSFEYFTSQKDELNNLAKQTWGYNISESMFNYLIFIKAFYTHGLEECFSDFREGGPMGFMQWLLFDRTKNLTFRTVNGEPVDIKLHQRFDNGPQHLVVISGVPEDGLYRYTLFFDSPEIPTCVARITNIDEDEFVARTLLEHLASLFLEDLRMNARDIFGRDEDENEDETEEQTFERYFPVLSKLYYMEQILKFEKVFDLNELDGRIFLEKRERIFNANPDKRLIYKNGFSNLGLYISDKVKLEEAREIIKSFGESMEYNDVLEKCSQAGNFYPLVYALTTHIRLFHMSNLDRISKIICDAYNKINIPLFGEINSLMIWATLNPGAVDDEFRVYTVNNA